MKEKEIFIVSACLAGLKTRYNAKSNPDPDVIKLLKEGKAIPLCPEQLGGLPTPREPVDFMDGDGEDFLKGKAKLIGKESGEDKGMFFLKGAEEVLNIIKKIGIKGAYMKEGSPSCGVDWVYINGKLTKGIGVTSALLKKAGVKLFPKKPPEMPDP